MSASSLLNSFEELQDNLRTAIQDFAKNNNGYSDNYACLKATFEDKVVFSVSRYVSGKGYQEQLLQAPYTVNEKTREVTLGEAVPVKMTIQELAESCLNEGGIPSFAFAQLDEKAGEAYVRSTYNLLED